MNNEQGNAALYLLWLLSIVAIIFVLTINIVKVYIVKEHANLAVEQAALAGTSVLLKKTKEGVEQFDTRSTLDPLYIADRALQLTIDLKSVGELIDEKKHEYMSRGMDEADAYIKAANRILPERINRHPYLKRELETTLGSSSSAVYYLVFSTIKDIIEDNNGRIDDTEIELTNHYWRLEVKSTVRFKSISDKKFITNFIEDIPQKGYGPTLSYLENVYS